MKNLLVVGQVALSMMLLISTGLFIRSLQATQSVDPGFGDEDAGIISIVLPTSRYDDEAGMTFLRTMTQRLEERPEVSSAGFITRLHLDPLNNTGLRLQVDGVEPPPGRVEHSIDVAGIGGNLLDALGIEPNQMFEERELMPNPVGRPRKTRP